MRMLIYEDEDHFSMLKAALQFQNRTDGRIHFYCSDGMVEVKSTYLKVHSKLLSQILPGVPFEELKDNTVASTCSKEHTVLLPDIQKSHILHLISLITFGKIQFSVKKLSEIESFSDVINEVLSTADLLEINVTNYGLDPEEDISLKPDAEYFELPEKEVKKQEIKKDSRPNAENKDHTQSNDMVEENDSMEIEEILTSGDDDSPAQTNCGATSNNPNLTDDEISRYCDNYRKVLETQLTGNNSKVEKERKRRIEKRVAELRELADTQNRIEPIKELRGWGGNLTCPFCSVCGQMFNNLINLRKHQFSEHWLKLAVKLREPPLKVKCVICPEKVCEYLMGAHVLGSHERKKLSVPCPQCGDMFKHHDAFYDHMKSHNNNEIPSVDKSIAEAEAVPLFSQVLKPIESIPNIPNYSYSVPLTSKYSSSAALKGSKPKISVIHPSFLMNPAVLTSSSNDGEAIANLHNYNCSDAPIFAKGLLLKQKSREVTVKQPFKDTKTQK